MTQQRILSIPDLPDETVRIILEAASPHMPKCSGRHWVDAPEDDSGW